MQTSCIQRTQTITKGHRSHLHHQCINMVSLLRSPEFLCSTPPNLPCGLPAFLTAYPTSHSVCGCFQFISSFSFTMFLVGSGCLIALILLSWFFITNLISLTSYFMERNYCISLITLEDRLNFYVEALIPSLENSFLQKYLTTVYFFNKYIRDIMVNKYFFNRLYMYPIIIHSFLQVL